MTSRCYHVQRVKLHSDLLCSAADSREAPPATDFSAAFSVLVSTTVVAVTVAGRGLPGRTSFGIAKLRAQCLARPRGEAVGFPSARVGAERARMHPRDPRGNEMGRRSLYLVTWLSKQNPEDASEMFLKLFATSRSRTIRSPLGAKSFAFLLAVRWQRVCERGDTGILATL